MRGQIARSDLNVPVVGQLRRQVCPARRALVLTDLKNSLLAIKVAGHVVGNLVAPARNTGAVGATMSVDERAVRNQRIENEQRVRIWRAERACLTVEGAGTPRSVRVSFVRDAEIVGWIISDVSDRAALDECRPPWSSRPSTLGGDLNDSVGGRRSVLRRRGGTLQNFECLYVFRVDVIEPRRHLAANSDRRRTGSAAIADVVVETNSVDHDQRLIGQRNGRRSTDPDSGCRADRSTGLLHIYARYFAREQLTHVLGAGDLFRLRLQRRYCGSDFAFPLLLSGGCRHHLLEADGGRREGEVGLRRSARRYIDRLTRCLIAESQRTHLVLPGTHRCNSISTVVTSDGTACGADNLDLRRCDGSVRSSVDDAPANCPRVLRANSRDDARKQHRHRRAGMEQPSYMLVHTASDSFPRVRNRNAASCRAALSTTTRVRRRAKSDGRAGDGVDGISSRIGRLMPASCGSPSFVEPLLAGGDSKSLCHSAISDRHHPTVLNCRRLVPTPDQAKRPRR